MLIPRRSRSLGRVATACAVALSIASALALDGWGGEGKVLDQNATLVVAFPAEPAIRDPALAIVIVLRRPMVEIFEGLVTKNWFEGPDALKIVPALATSWNISPDGRTYTFQLRRGVTFHDGTPFNAKAIEFNFRRWTDRNFQHYYPPAAAQAARDMQFVESFRAVDEHTFEIVLKERFGAFLDRLSSGTNLFIVSPAAIERFGNTAIGDHPIGTGPFIFGEYVRGERLVLHRNARYWRGPAAIRRLIFRPILEPSVRAAALETGEVQVAEEVSVKLEPRWEGRRDVVMKVRNQPKVWGCWLNAREGPGTNKAFREALSLATDRVGMNRAIYNGKSTPANGFYGPGGAAYEPSLPMFEYNLDKARAKLAEAGFPAGGKIVFEAAGSGLPFQPDVLTIQKENLRAIGVDLELRFFDLGTYIRKFLTGIPLGSGVDGHCLNPGTDDAFLLALVAAEIGFPEKGGFNPGYVTSTGIEAAVKKAIASRSDAQYIKAMQEANRALIRDAVLLMQVADPKVFGLAANVEWTSAQAIIHTYYSAKVYKK